MFDQDRQRTVDIVGTLLVVAIAFHSLLGFLIAAPLAAYVYMKRRGML